VSTKTTTKRPAAQVAVASEDKKEQPAWLQRPMPALESETPSATPAEHARRGIRLLDKAEVLNITGVTFPTIWAWMRAGTFPRSRVVGGKSMWLSTEVDAWLAALPVRPLKGDKSVAA
jgi:predicted DNA-binding transcriptional regulator AlpA